MFKPAPIDTRNKFGRLLNELGLLGEAVEVGTHRGEFAEALLSEWKGARLTCVDPWADIPEYAEQAAMLGGGPSREDDLAEAKRRLSRFGPRAVLLQATSMEVVDRFEDGSLDFVYVDGDHRQYQVMMDLIWWWDKVRPGGILAGHDWIQPGEKHRWADEVQTGLKLFLDGLQSPVDVELLVEDKGLPWSYLIRKPEEES